jgi:hypothetical protein
MNHDTLPPSDVMSILGKHPNSHHFPGRQRHRLRIVLDQPFTEGCERLPFARYVFG